MNILLFVLGAVIVYWLQLLFCKLIWKYKLTANAEFSENIATEGDTVKLTITVKNQKAVPIITVKTNFEIERGLEFTEQNNLVISDKNYRSEIFSLRGNEQVQRDIPLFCSKRGYYHIKEIDFVGNDLFYTQRFISHQNINAGICVYPGKAEVNQLMIATQKMTGEAVVPNSDCSDPFTFRGVRQYQSFDSIRDINWKASAKTGDLRVNIRDFTADREIVIILDTEWDSLLKPESLLEESIRIASSMANEFIGKGIVTSMITNGRDSLTNEMFQINGGSNVQHINSINYGLARIKHAKHNSDKTLKALLEKEILYMDSQPNKKISWVLISTQANIEILSLWNEISDKAVKSYWIIPAYTYDDIPKNILQNPDVMHWEVAYGE